MKYYKLLSAVIALGLLLFLGFGCGGGNISDEEEKYISEQITPLKESISSLHEDISPLHDEIASIQKDITSMGKEIVLLNTKMKRLASKAEITKVREEIASLKEETAPPEVVNKAPEAKVPAAEAFNAISIIAQEAMGLVAATGEALDQFFASAGPSIGAVLNCITGFAPEEGQEETGGPFSGF